ncbi:DUF397 domain-containing protein [Streptomyces sp. ISL-11]|uniref:DUF397 domain-containing protein n=1 Tax=Streptomyces sp. ISL-11 TaxID=2819174 RepID=UPI001BEA09A2|nr:DUF397 domain-containing protein [Streptomyces sp. ISL-11]MBT2386893.1 DUF397 domain-containing protein [Streptomyces sp. ISL-11]
MPQSSGPAIEWQKSSFSGKEGEQCIEVAELADAILIRESDDPGLIAGANRRRFAALIAGVKAGAFRC